MIVLTVSHDSNTLTIASTSHGVQLTFAPIKNTTQLAGILSELLNILEPSGVTLDVIDEGTLIKREEW